MAYTPPGIHEKEFKWAAENEEDQRLGKKLRDTTEVFVPQIEEIRAIEHNGEVYYNGKDLVKAMKYHAYSTNLTMSVLYFIRGFVFELITARR